MAGQASPPVVPAGTIGLLHSNGTAVTLILTTTPRPADIAVFAPGLPGAGAVVALQPVATPFTLPAGLAGSEMAAGTAATANATFAVFKNGAAVGSAQISSAGVVTLTAAAAVAFGAGDVLSVTAPAVQDATLADVGLTLHGFFN